jgi:ribonuclease-3
VGLGNPLSYVYKTRVSKHRNTYRSIRAITGITPSNIFCYLQALRHHSASVKIHENGSRDSNERLEFLGDAVLSAVVAELLFKRYPVKDEGFLTEMRSKIVSRESLNALAMKIGLNELVQYDKRALGAQLRNTIFGNALEAFIGAVYLDKGYEAAQQFILRKLFIHIDIDKIQQTETNFKGRLMEWAQRNAKVVEFEAQEIPDGKTKIYRVHVLVDKTPMATAENHSKKKAEQMAAEKTFEALLTND